MNKALLRLKKLVETRRAARFSMSATPGEGVDAGAPVTEAPGPEAPGPTQPEAAPRPETAAEASIPDCDACQGHAEGAPIMEKAAQDIGGSESAPAPEEDTPKKKKRYYRPKKKVE